jgi:predicted ATPase/class 3 adenylate cyclase
MADLGKRSMRQSKQLVTLVFTDIKGSTEMWERLGQHFRYILEAHNYIIRKSTKEHGGREVKTEGDAFMMSFDSPDDAIRFCIKAQEQLNAADWPGLTGEIMVRMGVHTGQPIFVKDRFGKIDYLGPMVNRASRISAAANGGQILISNATFEQAGSALDDVSVKNLGEHRLRGLEKPEVIRSILPKSLETRKFLAIRTMDVKKTNLSQHAKSFFGRERDIYQLHRFFNIDKAKIVTITGAGGTGKTRLSESWAATSLGDYPGGVWFVDLSDAENIQDVCKAVSGVVNTPLTDTDSVAQLGYAIKSMCENANGTVLMVLDNCEQIAKEAGQVVMRWLKMATKSRYLVTSRILMKIPSEKEHVLKHLNIPTIKQLDNIDMLKKFNSVQLFADRSYEANSEFELTTENIRDVAQICMRLDGIPLAIELAASRSRILQPAKILKRLENRFELLQSNLQDYNKRQRTLRETINWSWQLLDDDEKSVMAQLSIFNHAFYMAHAEAVVKTPRVDAPSVMNVIQGLREKSFLNLYDSQKLEGETALSVYESIREFAYEKLIESNLKTETEKRWKNWILQYSKDCWQDYQTLHCMEAYQRLSHVKRDLISLVHYPEVAVEEAAWAAVYILPILSRRGPGMDSKELIHYCLRGFDITYVFEKDEIRLNKTVNEEPVQRLILHLAELYQKSRPSYALSLARTIPEEAASYFEALLIISQSLLATGKPKESKEIIEKALKLTDIPLYKKSEAKLQEGLCLYKTGDYEKAHEAFNFVRENTSISKNKFVELGALAHLGLMQLNFGNTEEALPLLNQGLSLAKKFFDESGEALCLSLLGTARKHVYSEAELALNYFKRALKICRRTGEVSQQIYCLIGIADIYQQIDDLVFAHETYEQAIELAQKMGDISSVAEAGGHLGRIMHRQKEYDKALLSYEVALKCSRDLNEKRNEARWLGQKGRVMFEKSLVNKGSEVFAAQLKDAETCLQDSINARVDLKIIRDLEVEITMAQVKNEQGQSERAKELAQDILDISIKINDADSQKHLDIASKVKNILQKGSPLID